MNSPKLASSVPDSGPFELAVQLTMLGEREMSLPARMEPPAGARARLLVAVPVPVNSPVRVDLEDGLLLGEICYCVAQEEGCLVGLVLDQALTGTASLLRLMERLVGPLEDQQAAKAAAERRRQSR